MARFFLALAALAAIIATANFAAAAAPTENKATVLRFNHDAFQKTNPDAAAKFLSDDFIEHHPPQGPAERTKDQFIAMLKRRLDFFHEKDPVMVYAFEDRVLLVKEDDLPDPQNPGKTYQAFHFDLFRLAPDGKIAEHWDDGRK